MFGSAFFKKDAKSTRLYSFITSPSWLVYDCISGSIGGILTESISLVSIVVGVLKHDIKKNVKKQ